MDPEMHNDDQSPSQTIARCLAAPSTVTLADAPQEYACLQYDVGNAYNALRDGNLYTFVSPDSPVLYL